MMDAKERVRRATAPNPGAIWMCAECRARLDAMLKYGDIAVGRYAEICGISRQEAMATSDALDSDSG